MKNILVTGAAGQLGKCLQKITEKSSDLKWVFLDSSQFDITSQKTIEKWFQDKQIDFCVNCAAYTHVEKAEKEEQRAFEINAEAVKTLAETCSKYNTTLIHISTDYVFDGKSVSEYKEEDKTNPLNVYGASKLKGEEYIQNVLTNFFILRTSWLYSEFGHNFYKTILKKVEQKAELNITTAQIGTPTNANHLAEFIVEIIINANSNYGLYNFSNTGETTWHGFAQKILEVSGNLGNIVLNKDNSYKTVAKRPEYSVLSKKKLLKNFEYVPKSWDQAVSELYTTTTNY